MLLKKRHILKVFSFILVLLMLFSTGIFALAEEGEADAQNQLTNEDETEGADNTEDADEEKTEEEKELEAERRREAVNRLNAAVNPLKTQKPKFFFSSEQGMLVPKKQGGLPGLIGEVIGGIGGIIGGITGEPLDQFETILGYLLVSGSESTEYISFGKDEENRDRLPIKGKSYVSTLSANDEFEYDYKPFSYGGFNLEISFPDEVNPGANSALHKVFDLPTTEELYERFFNVPDDMDWSKVQIKYTNISLECRVNQKEELGYYRTYYEATIALSDTKDIDPLSLEFPESMFLAEISINNVDWTPRILGDGDGDGYIRASDARTCLRISAKLETVSPHDFPYFDVDKNGVITAMDARMILRAAANIESLE